MKLTFTLVLFSFFLTGCLSFTRETNEEYIAYGPRWIDYEGWGNLELGMSKKDVLEIMGEPYLPQQSYLHADSTIEILDFKIRTKYYPLRERSKVTLQNDEGKETISYNEKETKPAKYANANVWGNCIDLLCFFENHKLIRWYCPETLKLDSIQTTIDVAPLKIEKNKFTILRPSESKPQVASKAVTDTSPSTADTSSLKSYFYPIEKRRYVRIVTDAGYTFEVFLIGETPSKYIISNPSNNVSSFKKEKVSTISDIK